MRRCCAVPHLGVGGPRLGTLDTVLTANRCPVERSTASRTVPKLPAPITCGGRAARGARSAANHARRLRAPPALRPRPPHSYNTQRPPLHLSPPGPHRTHRPTLPIV
jgi:hypothetical protein